jgi:hypothetical protein
MCRYRRQYGRSLAKTFTSSATMRISGAEALPTPPCRRLGEALQQAGMAIEHC